MRIFLLLFASSLILTQSIFCQNFMVTWEVNGSYLSPLGDINGDGAWEFAKAAESGVEIYSSQTKQILYTLSNIEGTFNGSFNIPYQPFDFNQNDVKDVIFISSNGFQIIDPSTTEIIYNYSDVLATDNGMNKIDDYDGDGILDIFYNGYRGGGATGYFFVMISTGIAVTSVKSENSLNSDYILYPNYPNPFNPTTTIEYTIPKAGNVDINIYDISGQLVKRYNQNHNASGSYSVIWDGKNNYGAKAASGTYFYQIISGDFVSTKKMILLK